MEPTRIEPYIQKSEGSEETGLILFGDGIRIEIEYPLDKLEELSQDLSTFVDKNQSK